jgi:manganese/zinc/iron transport system permease protein
MVSIHDILNIITALLIAWSCSLLGVFLVLRKMVMVGDAISHSVLPGIVIAYLISNQTESYLILVGAAIFGVFTTVMIEFLYKKLKLQEDASIGLTFTWLFALGVLLIAFFTGSNAEIDQECVLFGEIGLSFLDKIIWNGYLIGTKSIWMITPVLIAVAATVIKGFKGFQLLCFQSEYGDTKGISSSFWHYLLMVMVSLVTVFSFESVGAILVVGFLVVPPATAYLLTDDLKKMHVYSLLLSTFSVFIGYFLSINFDVSISPCIVLVSGLVFFLTFMSVKVKNKSKLKAKSLEIKN